ncbi:MAG: biotin carboxylase N-terminal domain-containing protein [Deltaproteobacteria bacterium]|nr:biotin carboxylase N-terminal domain-containing protein [Myxococcales bacterium]MDP3213881.1 biotin carboxylase N-terminal domain-containing protein [Deltaproteobacteria bacterium]
MSLLHRPFRRVGVVNRGEAAVRFLRAARAWSRCHREPMEVVALYTHPDRDAMFVREADDAVLLGDALVPGSTGALRSAYLDVPRVISLLVEARCDAVWPGWGFVSERPDFADACADAGLVFIGPSGSSMRLLGDKIGGKRVAEDNGVPVTPWSGGPVADAAEAAAHATRIGFPVLLKAAAGGGGRGIRIVRAVDEVAAAFASASAEARSAFGDPTLLVESFAPEARHVEVQIIADSHGTVHAVGTRDCSMQRRHQKVLEEAPAPGLGALEEQLKSAAVRIARASGYVNAGTAEFLVRPDLSGFYFLEMNTRLQVEHPVTECVTGLDLVGMQIDVARGVALPASLPPPRGHAVEARLNAEDPDEGFRPSAGRLIRFELATGPGVRVDSGFVAGDVVPGEFDSMLAKVIASGPTREDALARLEEALARSTVAIEGGASNRSLLLELVAHDALRDARVTTRWLDQHIAERTQALARRHLDAALVAAAIGEHQRARADEIAEVMLHAHRGMPTNVPQAEPRTFRFAVGGASLSLEVLASGPDRYRVTCAGQSADVTYQATGPGTAVLTLHGRRLAVVQVVTPVALHVEVDSVAHRLARASDGRVVAPVPAAVTEVCVREGAMVAEGERLMTLEVMKMEVAIEAPVAGRIGRLLVGPSSLVTAGQCLAVIEGRDAERWSSVEGLAPLRADAPTDPGERASALRLGTVLGYDFPAREVNGSLGLLRDAKVRLGRAELARLLDAYVSHERLFDTARGPDGVAPVDHLARYLRPRRGSAQGFPDGFVAKVRAALLWHEVRDADAAARHDDATLRVLQAHRALALRDRVIHGALAAAVRDDRGDATEEERTELRERLEAFAAIVVHRDRALSEAAYTVVYHLCDRPRQSAQARTLGRAAAEAFARLVAIRGEDGDAAAARRAAIYAELDELPHGALLALVPVAPALALRAPREKLLALLTRRMHPRAERERALDDDTTAALYRAPEGAIVAVLSSPAEMIADAALALDRLAPVAGEAVEVDVFVAEPDAQWLAELHADGAARLAGMPRGVERFSVTWGNVEAGRLSRTFTRRGDGEFAEDVFLRDFHPARVEACEIARLRAFELERLPAPGEVFLAVARSRQDPSDERLVCIVEVERIDPEYDPATGALRSIPGFERVYLTALHAMRDAQAVRARDPKPFWNRLVVFTRPLLTLTREEMMTVTRRLAPATAGLGLEKMILRARRPDPAHRDGRPVQVEWTNPTGHGATLTTADPDAEPVSALTADERRIVEARRKGLFYPYELLRALSRDDDAGPFPPGTFTELDLAPDGERLVPAERPFGHNAACIVVGVVTSRFDPFPEGLSRVLLVGDPTRAMGSLAEPECRRIIAALDLAEREGMPVEWVAVSSGARIAMDSGTENLDWTARVLARIVRFTQARGTIHVIVDGINVGAQSYWNAEATMLLHCRGALIMTPQGAMLLTGKRALEYAGSVAAEDNNGIGGYERVMGPNGEAQYFAADLTAAYRVLFRHLALTAVAPGERRPRRTATLDPVDRDVTLAPYGDEGDEGYRTVGEIFDEATNPGRKRPFAIRPVMRAVLDQDTDALERWAAWQGAESAVVWEGRLGGDPVCCIGIESRPVARRGDAPADGPDHWTSGTLFPLSSRKVARAISAASGARPVVVLANLSGFDGSPDSLRQLQLEHGAEIGRAVVNFEGTFVFCVVSRYHGGAYVVFSRALNPAVEALALQGSFASVIGGGPAAAVVFPGLVRRRADADPEVVAARRALEAAPKHARAGAAGDHERVLKAAQAKAQSAIAKEFDGVHTVERALKVGSLDAVIAAQTLRPRLIARVRGG